MVRSTRHQPFLSSVSVPAHKSSQFINTTINNDHNDNNTTAASPSASSDSYSSSSTSSRIHSSCASAATVPSSFKSYTPGTGAIVGNLSSANITPRSGPRVASLKPNPYAALTSLFCPDHSNTRIAWHQRRKSFWPFSCFNMHSLTQYRYTGLGRKRPSFSITASASSRSFQKVSQRHQSKFLTVLLIALPFAIAVFFTVDLRSRVVPFIQHQQVSQSSRSSSLSPSPHTGPYLTSTNNSHMSDIGLTQHGAPVSASDAITDQSSKFDDHSHSSSLSSSSSHDAESASLHASTNLPTTTMATTTESTTTESTTATTSTTTTAAAPVSSKSESLQHGVDQLESKPSHINTDHQNLASVDNGIPPPSLPKDHPDYETLEAIRARTQLTPRWPPSAVALSRQLRTYGPAYSSILVSHELKVVYLPVFKVATTSMMWNIAYLENNPIIMEAHRQGDVGEMMKIVHDMSSPAWYNHTVFELTRDEMSVILDDPEYLKFGFVRNPYDRIVSAYVDKVVRADIELDEYQDQMYSLFGNDVAIRQRVNQTRPSFREFLDAVKKVMAMPRTPPSGWEVTPIRRDIHWRPQVELIHPDLVHLDFVGHFDRMEEDRKIIISWMHRHTDRRLPSSSTARLHSTDPSHKKELFELLRRDAELRNLLLTIYAEDFSRFHFSTEVPSLDG